MTLSFRLGRVPIRIHPVLPMMGLVVGLGAQDGIEGTAARASAFLVTVLVHELAHALAARSFGVPADVNLTLLRGTLGTQIASLTSLRRVVVHLAGPLVNIGIGTALWVLGKMLLPAGEAGRSELRYFAWINLGWGLVNLLPILPLDAGHALGAALDRATAGAGQRMAQHISIGVAAVLGFAALSTRMIFPALLCSVVALQNVFALRRNDQNKDLDLILRTKLHAAFEALERGEATVGVAHCRAILELSTNRVIRKDATRLLVYAYATTNAWPDMMRLLESGGALALEDNELEKYEDAVRDLGRLSDARRIASLRGELGGTGAAFPWKKRVR
jgi:Zn-dependent protease